MKLSIPRLLLVAALFAVLAAAWSKEDYEIFRVRDEVAASEGTNVTFYDFLGIRQSASQDDINKAYRKKSRTLHPDKVKRSFVANASKDKSRAKSNKGVNVSQGPSQRQINAAVKQAHERSARLNIVANILRGPGRDRYDYFLRNGFPMWKGTGYYYSRFRPGLGSVLTGLLLVFGGGAHYAALVLSWRRQREFVERYIRQARRAAWGDETGVRGIPGLDAMNSPAPAPAPDSEPEAVSMTRRQKRMMDRGNKKEAKKGNKANARGSGTSTPTAESTGPTGERKRVVAENGKILIVDSIGSVYLEEETEDGERQEFLLDIEEIQRPTIRDTMLFRFPVWCYGKTVGRALGSSKVEEEDLVDEDSGEDLEPTVEETTRAVKSNGGPRRRGKRSQKS